MKGEDKEGDETRRMEVRESEIGRRERAVYQLAESSLPDWLPSPCLFFPVHRFVLFYSRASNTRTRAQVDTYRSGCFVEGDVIDRQIYPGEVQVPWRNLPLFTGYTITCINTNDPPSPPFFFVTKGSNRICDRMHERRSVDDYIFLEMSLRLSKGSKKPFI